MINVQEILDDESEAISSEFLKFERVENKKSSRPDIHAFILLNELQPGTSDMVSAAGHDVIYLDVDIEKLGEVATREQIIELSRCGVHFDGDGECLALFV